MIHTVVAMQHISTMLPRAFSTIVEEVWVSEQHGCLFKVILKKCGTIEYKVIHRILAYAVLPVLRIGDFCGH